MFDAQVRSIIATVVDGFIIIDDKGHVQSFNKAAGKIFGCKPNEALGRNVDVLVPEPFQIQHNSYLSNNLITSTQKIIGIGRAICARRKEAKLQEVSLSAWCKHIY
ncbi:PAS domain S-box protein [Thalassotalea euphylliae]|uniref:PAS domain S-box protein n=1 Tax=Thalassotalea euphylliae TaxID=1655234 RepID=A0A3E0TWC3_9GAMM|nr:PAS domain S-box protein [Thalassotalea euphylliae]REL28667.1 PAS domain S-box protein [Thalassotalea euphylliae]